jgi:replicative DNA helicase
MRQASNAIQRIAYEHGVVTVALSQYNRATSFNRDAPPTVQGMTGGSDLENDSDQSVLLDHTARKRVGNRSEGKVLLAKNRHGPEVDIPVVWDYSTLRVMQAAPDPRDRTEHRHGL